MAWAREDLAWLAGLYEGEGCVTLSEKGPLRIQIAMTDKDVLDTFQRKAGMGGVSSRPYDKGGLGNKPSWDYRVSGRKAYALLVAMWPWLHARRQERIREQVLKWLQRPHHRKLTAVQVRDIRSRLNVGPHGIGTALAVEYGVSDGMISAIKTGRAFKEVV